jgi:hypothetical protein
MWLNGANGQPLIIVYFHGPDSWHRTKWEFAVATGKPGWIELTSKQVKLRLWLDPDTGEAQVQSDKVYIQDANTYLVLHVLDAKQQRVVALGVLDLPASPAAPASVLLLRGHPELVEKMKKVIADAPGG